MKKALIFFTIVFTCLQLSAQKNTVWISATARETSGHQIIGERLYSKNQQLFKFNNDEFKKSLINVADKFSGLPGVQVSFPNIDGELEKFLVWENSNFEPGLQAKNTNIRAYTGKSLTDKGATIHFSLSSKGIQTMVLRPDRGTEFIESYTTDNALYVLFDSKTRVKDKLPFNCEVIDRSLSNDVSKKIQNTAKTSVLSYKTLRLAISCTGEYAQYYGGTVEKALEGMNATMTRVNGLYEKDLAVHLNIINDDERVIYTDPDTDPYVPASIGTTEDPNDSPFHIWSTELQGALTSELGNGAYDIGHLFGVGKGEGNSGGIGNVCVNDTGAKGISSKGKAYSSTLSIPEGDTFDISTVAHEMGHQLGAQHTFSFQLENGLVQVEPGSGSTIMGYAGITNWNVQQETDDYFTFNSISQIQNTLATKSCPVSMPITDNMTPTVDAGADFSVPSGTAYILKGIASDADGDSLSYCWEQNDTMTSNAQGGNLSIPYPTKTKGPTFRSYLPVSSPVRYMPNFSDVLAGNGTLRFGWESVSTVARTLHFTLTVRDNNVINGAQTQTDEVIVTSKAPFDAVNKPDGVGPFVVTSQKITGISWTVADTQNITWSVNNTTSLPGSTDVNIKLSIDGGITFPYVLAANTPNDGTEVITVPETSTTSSNCRILIEPAENIYYAVNSYEFTIISNLAVKDYDFQNFVLSPNPNKGNFTVQFDNPLGDEVGVNVYDMRGRKIFENRYSSQATFNENIKLNDAQAGIYLVSIVGGNSKAVKRIIIE